jgi:hypothetical protein
LLALASLIDRRSWRFLTIALALTVVAVDFGLHVRRQRVCVMQMGGEGISIEPEGSW